MAFLSKLFGKNKDKNKNKNDFEESLQNGVELHDSEELHNSEEFHDNEEQFCGDDVEAESDEGLTDEEIEAAEHFEDMMREEIVSSQTLDYDGEFIEDDESDKDTCGFENEKSDYDELSSENQEKTDEEDLPFEEGIQNEVSDIEANEIGLDEEGLANDSDNVSDSTSDDIDTEDTDTGDEEDESEKEEKISFWRKLKNGLSKTKKALWGQVDELLKNFVKVDEDMLEELEELLIMADVGVNATSDIIEQLRERIKDGRLKEKDQVMSCLKEIVGSMIGDSQGLALETTPSVILVIGVNGAGKTTSIGKISKRLRQSGKKVIVAAADTFRAAAIDQLAVWCDRAGVEMVRQNEGSDPAAVVFDAINYTKKKQADILIIDTAGRLQNKANLMNELAKINRVIDRELPGASRENLLVLDATTGQNAVIQAKEFSKAANITGITLNKLDGSAKGGIVISIRRELGIPVKFIGVGEKIDDMREFNSHDFVEALFE